MWVFANGKATLEGAYFSPDNGERIARTVRAYEAGPSGLILPPRQLLDRDYARQPFRNNSGETVPAYAAMRITGTEQSDGIERLIIAKPNSSSQQVYLVNGSDPVADTAQGWGTWLWHGDWLLYDDANTPAYGETWGPQNASWEVKKDNPGFVILGGATGGSTDLVMAAQTDSGGETDQIIQLNHASATAGDIVAANASGVHPARIKTWNGSGYTNSTAVWLLLTDYYDVDAGDVIGEHGKYYGPAKLAGTLTVSSDTRPLYIAQVGDQTFVGQCASAVAKGASGTFKLYHRATETDSGITKSAKATGVAIVANKFVTVQRISGHWKAGCWET